MEKVTSIGVKALEALKAAAQLAAHPEVVARTILAARDAQKRVSLDEAFPATSVQEATVASYQERAYEKA